MTYIKFLDLCDVKSVVVGRTTYQAHEGALGEAELMLSIFGWVELEARGFPPLLAGLCRLRGAVMKALG